MKKHGRAGVHGITIEPMRVDRQAITSSRVPRRANARRNRAAGTRPTAACDQCPVASVAGLHDRRETRSRTAGRSSHRYGVQPRPRAFVDEARIVLSLAVVPNTRLTLAAPPGERSARGADDGEAASAAMCPAGPASLRAADGGERQLAEMILREQSARSPGTSSAASRTGIHSPPANASGRLIKFTIPGAPAGGIDEADARPTRQKGSSPATTSRQLQPRR